MFNNSGARWQRRSRTTRRRLAPAVIGFKAVIGHNTEGITQLPTGAGTRDGEVHSWRAPWSRRLSSCACASTRVGRPRVLHVAREQGRDAAHRLRTPASVRLSAVQRPVASERLPARRSGVRQAHRVQLSTPRSSARRTSAASRSPLPESGANAKAKTNATALSAQSRGYGKLLMTEAEKIVLREGYARVAVIASVGTHSRTTAPSSANALYIYSSPIN